MVMDNRGQTVRAISRCVWDPEKDRCMKTVFQNQEVLVVATVFAIYYE